MWGNAFATRTMLCICAFDSVPLKTTCIHFDVSWICMNLLEYLCFRSSWICVPFNSYVQIHAKLGFARSSTRGWSAWCGNNGNSWGWLKVASQLESAVHSLCAEDRSSSFLLLTRLRQIESACSVWHKSRIDFSTSSDSVYYYSNHATHASLSHPDDIEQVWCYHKMLRKSEMLTPTLTYIQGRSCQEWPEHCSQDIVQLSLQTTFKKTERERGKPWTLCHVFFSHVRLLDEADQFSQHLLWIFGMTAMNPLKVSQPCGRNHARRRERLWTSWLWPSWCNNSESPLNVGRKTASLSTGRPRK